MLLSLSPGYEYCSRQDTDTIVGQDVIDITVVQDHLSLSRSKQNKSHLFIPHLTYIFSLTERSRGNLPSDLNLTYTYNRHQADQSITISLFDRWAYWKDIQYPHIPGVTPKSTGLFLLLQVYSGADVMYHSVHWEGWKSWQKVGSTPRGDNSISRFL